MSTIFVLGTSIAGIKAALEIQKSDTDAKVTVYPLGVSGSIDPDQIAQVLAKRKSMPEIAYPTDGLKIELEQVVSKVNLKRKRIYLDNREQVPFDQLIITDTGSWKLPDIKGTNKSGSFVLKNKKNLEDFLEQVLLSEDVVIQSDRLEGLFYALALTRRERTVTLAYTGRSLLPFVQDEAVEKAFIQFCAEKGLTVYPQTSIAEILGDSDAKAVRLSGGKVIAAQCILFTEGRLDVRIFSEAPELRHGLMDINDQYLTTVSDIYAIGEVSSLKNLSREQLEVEGYRLAQILTGKTLDAKELPLLKKTLFLGEDITFTQLGSLEKTESSEEKVYAQEKPFAYKKFVFEKGYLKGALLINASLDEARIEALLREKTPIEGILEQFAFPEMVANDT